MRVDIERVREIRSELGRYNSVPLEALEIYENGERVVLTPEQLEDYRCLGLCNSTLLEMHPIVWEPTHE